MVAFMTGNAQVMPRQCSGNEQAILCQNATNSCVFQKFVVPLQPQRFLDMNIIKTPIEGLLVIEPQVFKDARGYFVETYNEQRYREAGIDTVFVQDNQSCSSYGVVRGLHFQRPPYSQAKLVCCTVGRVLDVAVDLRKNSPTYGKWYSVELSEENKRQFYVPRGFAHGFSVLSETAIFTYKCDNFYHTEADGGILLSDPILNIDWQVPADKMILSEKDQHHPLLADVDNPF